MSPRDKRALRWGSGIMLVSVFALRLLPRTVSEVRAQLSALELQRSQLAVARAELAGLPGLEAATHLMTQRIAGLAPRLLPAASEGEASASIAGELTHVALANRLVLTQVVPVPDSGKAGGLRRTSALATLEGDIHGLDGLLKGLLESAVVIVPTRLRVTGTDPTYGARGPERLQIELEVSAWYLPRN